MEFDGFDWDEGNAEKCRKHGLSRAEIEAAFAGDLAVFSDRGHSGSELRFRAVGSGAGGRRVFIVFTLRPRAGQVLLRPISARPMHEKEVRAFETANPRLFERR